MEIETLIMLINTTIIEIIVKIESLKLLSIILLLTEPSERIKCSGESLSVDSILVIVIVRYRLICSTITSDVASISYLISLLCYEILLLR